eukprot:symbB.v1.2.012092.t1/scaffold821.1/size257772/2
MVLKQPDADIPEVPMVFILDDELTMMMPGEEDAGLRLHPDAELSGWLLAKEGTLVLRLPAQKISEICVETGCPGSDAVTVDSVELPPFAGWLQDLGRTSERLRIQRQRRCQELEKSESALRRLLEVRGC